MTLAEQFISELRQETAATKRVLKRVPPEKLGWKPHSKSLSLGQLAMHIAVLPRGIADLITETEREPPVVPRPEAKSVEELLTTVDDSVAYAAQKIAAWGDEGLNVSWRMVRGGKTIIELPRSAMIRTIMLNHWYHHRGQLMVYLRLLDVPLPPVYGPTADEERMPIE